MRPGRRPRTLPAVVGGELLEHGLHELGKAHDAVAPDKLVGLQLPLDLAGRVEASRGRGPRVELPLLKEHQPPVSQHRKVHLAEGGALEASATRKRCPIGASELLDGGQASRR
eukprot:scaffold909_cov121-Isochrysis_galbana.AAC.12